jgi:hypothetical protein
MRGSDATFFLEMRVFVAVEAIYFQMFWNVEVDGQGLALFYIYKIPRIDERDTEWRRRTQRKNWI